MSITGFNPEKVKTSIGKVKDAYNDLYDALVTITKSNFVDKMAKSWYCDEAVDFFVNAFKPAIDGLVKGSKNTFVSVVDSMNSAASEWARRTGNSSIWSNVNFDPRSKEIDVTGIKTAASNGDVGIDETNASSAAATLSSKTMVKASNALAKAKSAVVTCGFLGGGQASELQNSLNSIASKIEETTNELTSKVKSAIDQSVTEYGDTGSKVTGAFGGK